ncbi:acyl carrier protein [Mucilaginibacter gilvus]|uniref:Acyl carrier protein n=1 Tax=Mucilaginibacter gilvus TaxID=2305909 RepID=A0A3S3Z4Q3_9SPHI|nr:acyl carrier protein [Mucilaginibacter gilvus]RWY57319.1 acyl carrier protein [Mucilaginibacter gilvus]
MDIEKFIVEFADQYDEIETDGFGPDTKFKENEEWSSMTALSVIAMVDDSYSVRLTGDDVRKSSTIQEVYDIVASRINS